MLLPVTIDAARDGHVNKESSCKINSPLILDILFS